MVKQVIFDLDGTLIDSADSIIKSLQKTLSENKIQPILQLEKSIIGPPLESTLKKITGFEDPSIIACLIRDFKASYDDNYCKEATPYEGVDEMLRLLHRHSVVIHIATNKRAIPTKKILDYLSWASLFKSVYTVDMVTPKYISKKVMLSSMLKKNNLTPKETIYIGDINTDYFAANENGMGFIFVQWGYEGEGDYLYPSKAANVQELIELILR